MGDPSGFLRQGDALQLGIKHDDQILLQHLKSRSPTSFLPGVRRKATSIAPVLGSDALQHGLFCQRWHTQIPVHLSSWLKKSVRSALLELTCPLTGCEPKSLPMLLALSFVPCPCIGAGTSELRAQMMKGWTSDRPTRSRAKSTQFALSGGHLAVLVCKS